MATNLDDLLKQFLRERKYLRNVSPQTIEWYETAWKAFCDSAISCLTDPASLNRSHLEQFVYALRDRGVRPVTCNTWLKAAFAAGVDERRAARIRSHLGVIQDLFAYGPDASTNVLMPPRSPDPGLCQ